MSPRNSSENKQNNTQDFPPLVRMWHQSNLRPFYPWRTQIPERWSKFGTFREAKRRRGISIRQQSLLSSKRRHLKLELLIVSLRLCYQPSGILSCYSSDSLHSQSYSCSENYQRTMWSNLWHWAHPPVCICSHDGDFTSRMLTKKQGLSLSAHPLPYSWRGDPGSLLRQCQGGIQCIPCYYYNWWIPSPADDPLSQIPRYCPED